MLKSNKTILFLCIVEDISWRDIFLRIGRQWHLRSQVERTDGHRETQGPRNLESDENVNACVQ